MPIHPTAIIDRQVELDASVEIGPYVVIEGPVRIGARTRIRANTWLCGWTHIGDDCDIFPFVSIGANPQDFHHKGERSYCRVGNRVTVREGVTIHRGTQAESATIIGDDCALLAQSHVGHNAVLGRGVTLINTAQVAGHVEIADRAILSGAVLTHQFCRIGELAFIAGNARAGMDVPPFMTCHGESTIVHYNLVGMRRAGMDHESIAEIRAAFRTLYRSGLTFRKATDQVAQMVRTDAGRRLVDFLQAPSKRGLAAGGRHRRRDNHTLDLGAGHDQ